MKKKKMEKKQKIRNNRDSKETEDENEALFIRVSGRDR